MNSTLAQWVSAFTQEHLGPTVTTSLEATTVDVDMSEVSEDELPKLGEVSRRSIRFFKHINSLNTLAANVVKDDPASSEGIKPIQSVMHPEVSIFEPATSYHAVRASEPFCAYTASQDHSSETRG